MAKATKVSGLDARTPLGEAAPRLLLARLADLRRLERRVEGAAPSAAAVHDLRVACRRLRAALDVLGDRALREHDAAVKRLQDALGRVRDAQLLGAWAADRGPRLAARFGKELEAARAALGPALRGWSQAAPRLEAGIAAQRRKGRLGGHRVERRVKKALRRARRRLGPARASRSPADVHALRKALKKLRYALEVAEPALGGRARALLKAIEPLQDLLGAVHDQDAKVARLRSLRARPLARSEASSRVRQEPALRDALSALRKSALRL